MVIRKLKIDDNAQLEELIEEIEVNLDNTTFWLPITPKSREHFWDDEWTCFLGAFEKNKLIGALGLFLNENEFGESKEYLEISDIRVAEYGRAMVSVSNRNKGVMSELSIELLKHAKEIGIKYVIATVHPQNIASQMVVKSLGFQKKGFVIKSEIYERDIMLLEIEDEK